MAKKRLTPQDRIALDNWNELVASVREHSDINPTDTETEIRQRRERLEKNDEEWFKYYFAMYCTCESAAFHKKATGRLMRNNRWYEVRAWSRELAKSARSMMEISKLALTKKIRNVLLISNSADNAERLLLPFMANFEENQRIRELRKTDMDIVVRKNGKPVPDAQVNVEMKDIEGTAYTLIAYSF